MGLIKKLFSILLVIVSFNAKSQITEARWEVISSKNFDLYLPKSSELDYYRLLSDAEKHLVVCENLFDFHLNESIRLVLSKSENIVKVPVSLNNSKSTEVEFDRHTGYIMSNSEYNEILLQVKNTIVSILVNDLMFGKSFQERVQNTALLQVPNWAIKGLSAYCNQSWLSSYDGILREYFQKHKQPGFNLLIEEDETLAGFSFWKYLVETYGEQNIANVLYIAHLTRSVENGLFFVYGKSMPELMIEWRNYYSEIYNNEFKDFKNVQGSYISHTAGLENISISPDGRWLAGVHYEEFKTKIYCLNLKSKNKTLINTSNGTNDVKLRWRNNGKINELLYKITETGAEQIVFYNPSRGRNTKYINIKDFDKLLNFDVDTAGNYVFYGVRKSRTYLVHYTSKTQKLETVLTQTNILDLKIFRNIVYFTESTDGTNNIISYNGILFDTLLVIKSGTNFKLLSIDSAEIIYQGNNTGINQLYRFNRSNKSINALTDFTSNSEVISITNLMDQCFYLKGIFGAWKTYSSPLFEIDTNELPQSYYSLFPKGKVMYDKKMVLDPSIKDMKDTISDTNSRYYFLNGFSEEDEKEYQHQLDSMKKSQKENKINISVNKVYDLNFSTLKVSLLQLDNTNFFNMLDIAPLNPNGFQYFYYYNYLKSELALKDILNKYQILGGLRLSTNLGGGYDAYLKFEKTYKRYTFQASVYYFQKRFDTPERNILKQQIQKAAFVYNFRYTNTITLKAGAGIMPYSNTILSTEKFGLNQKNINTIITSITTEFQYNRIKRYSDFIYRGVSVQVQPQLYFNSTTNHINSIVKAVVKYYKPVYRRIIWSNQVLLSTSGGKDKVVNILGGAENWMFARYDEQNQLSRTANYQLRSYAGAIRGFRQNARSGNNSLCVNSELRIPLAGLLSRWPSDRNWYQNLLLIPFADIGSAWGGLNLFDTENNYTVRVLDYNSSARNIASVEVKNLRDPIIGGIGCGINTRIIGYNFRFDMAFGIEDGQIKKPLYLFSYGANF